MRKRYHRPIYFVQKITFLVLLRKSRDKKQILRYRWYTLRTKNSTVTTAKFKCHSLLSQLSHAPSTFSIVGSFKGVLTSEFFTTGTSSMLLYSMLSKDIHSISYIYKTQEASCCCMAIIRSGLTLSVTFSSTFNMLLLSAL